MLAKVQLINLSKESINPGSSEQQFFFVWKSVFLILKQNNKKQKYSQRKTEGQKAQKDTEQFRTEYK
jgi:hypothetical protein